MRTHRDYSLHKGLKIQNKWGEQATVTGWNQDVSKVYVQYSTSHIGLTCVLDSDEIAEYWPVGD